MLPGLLEPLIRHVWFHAAQLCLNEAPCVFGAESAPQRAPEDGQDTCHVSLKRQSVASRQSVHPQVPFLP